ncbi:helix-turn-helix domain-containing protein [Fructilactobacillus frigidiflavus]|uniref:helix-turn-helix domain-containing protein n=1 Tax=Fructilactobacillus frigidiflavus TaxID=3242688 RepID=UPI00375782DB
MLNSNLKKIVEDKKVSINKFSNEIGISRPTLTKIISSDVVPEETKISSLYRICKGLNLPFSSVFYFSQKITSHDLFTINKSNNKKGDKFYILNLFIENSNVPLVLIGYKKETSNDSTMQKGAYFSFATMKDIGSLQMMAIVSSEKYLTDFYDNFPKIPNFENTLNSDNDFMNSIDGNFKYEILNLLNSIFSKKPDLLFPQLYDYEAYNFPLGNDAAGVNELESHLNKDGSNKKPTTADKDHYYFYNFLTGNENLNIASIKMDEELNKINNDNKYKGINFFDIKDVYKDIFKN